MTEPRPPRAHPVTVRGLLFALTVLLALAPASAHAAGAGLWKTRAGKPPARHDGKPAAVEPERFRALTADHAGLRDLLADAPVTISLPAPGGGFARFAVRPSEVMAPELAADHPEIRTYAGQGIDDPAASVHLDIGPIGFHASVRDPGGTWYIDPYYQRDRSLYASYRGRALEADTAFDEGPIELQEPVGGAARTQDPNQPVDLRTYRLALLTDPQYTAYHRGEDGAVAAKVALVNRVNQVYEDDLGIRLQLIDADLELAADEMTEEEGLCGTQPCFTPAQASSCLSSTLTRARVVLGQLAGADAFDVGHLVLGTDGGGLATLGVVGGPHKAEGCTGLANPVGDAFAVDYLAHELGHQFRANHTFNGTSGQCAGRNRNPGTAVEPGSGSSIMAYAGICTDPQDRTKSDDLQLHSDPYFHGRSVDEIAAYAGSAGVSAAEVQSFSFARFSPGESFRLSYGGTVSSPIALGTTYTASTVEAAVEELTGVSVQSVTGFGGAGFGPAGFQVTFSGTGNPAQVELTGVTGDAAGTAGTTIDGGPERRGGTVTPTANRAPAVTSAVPAGVTIPLRTPFTLSGAGSDLDGDVLTYSWEQHDDPCPLSSCTVAGTALFSSTKANGPLFRQFGAAAVVPQPFTSPATGLNQAPLTPTRAFPDLAQVLADRTNATGGTCPAGDVECFSEFLPTSAYTPAAMTFRLTARDGRGGVASAESTLTLAKGAGPFRITRPAGGFVAPSGGPLTVTWNVANTGAGTAVDAADVAVDLSTDGGVTFEPLLPSTPNDGVETVQLPPDATTRARIRVSAVGNVFFDVSHGDFVVANTTDPVITDVSPGGEAQLAYTDGFATPPTITAFDNDTAPSNLAATAPGLPAGLALTPQQAPTGKTRSWTVTGQTTAAPGTYDVPVTVSDGDGPTSTRTLRIVVTPEQAAASYTGELTSAAAGDAPTALVRLAATVAEAAQDGDGTRGDIALATVAFTRGETTLCTAPVAADGTAGCGAALPLGDSTVGIAVGGHYRGNATQVVTVVAGAPTADPPAPVAAGRLAPVLARVARRPKVSRTGRFTVPVQCRVATTGARPERCRGVVVVTAKIAGERRTIARKRFAVAPGRTVRVRLRLTRAARRVLRTRRLNARLSVAVANGASATASARKTLVLRRP